MPAQHRRSRGLATSPRASALPMPGISGYAYPRGPFGASGFPGSTPASRKTKGQGRDGRKDPSYQGRPTITATGIRARDTGPEFDNPATREVPRPQTSYGQVRFRPGTSPRAGNTYIAPSGLPRNPKARRLDLTTGPEHRMTPVFDVPMEVKTIRNDRAQRWKAAPGQIRDYRPSPNPGHTGAQLDGPSQFHPGQMVHGHPDGKPIPGSPGTVTVLSRAVFGLDAESSDYYAMNREERFTKGGTPAPYPAWYRGDRHLRGGRLTGQRYFGDIEDQQQIGLPTDAYGISRARGPRHRPVRFEQPPSWSANYYDAPAPAGATSPDLVHQSPSGPRNRQRHSQPATSSNATSGIVGAVVSALTGGSTSSSTPAAAASSRRATTTQLRRPRRG